MIYLDNSATTRKKPITLGFTVLREAFFSANPGRGGHKASVNVALKIEEVRDKVKENFFDGNVIFTKNCTEALNLGINGIKPFGQVITTVYEHNSVLRTLKKLENEGKIKMKIIYPVDGDFTKQLIEALKTKTSLVVMTVRSNVTGQITNIERLAEIVKSKSEAIVLADGAQSAGHDKLDYKNIDIFATSGHKGLMGVQGTGFLLCKKNIKLYPLITGGTGTSGNNIDIPIEIPEGMEAGTLNSLGIIALGNGIRYAFDNMDRINIKISKLSKAVIESIKPQKNVILYPSEGGIVLFNILGLDSSTLADILSNRYGICVRGGYHCAPFMHRFLGTSSIGAVRVSFGDNNNMHHAIKIIKAIKEIAQSVK